MNKNPFFSIKNGIQDLKKIKHLEIVFVAIKNGFFAIKITEQQIIPKTP